MPSPSTPTTPSYLVLGGGLSGLAAAAGIVDADPGARVTVLEGRDRVGGTVRWGRVAGLTLDVGAESFATGRPEALDLVARADLSADVEHEIGESSRATVRGGLHRLPQTLAARLIAQGVTLRTGTLVRELHRRSDGGYEVVTGPRPAPTAYRADRVVLALPAAPTARLLTSLVPRAADRLRRIETTSLVVVTLALPADRLGDLPGTVIHAPPTQGLAIRTAAHSSARWPWVRELGRSAGRAGEDLAFLRVVLGRHGEATTLQHPDRDLVEIARADLAHVLDRDLPAHGHDSAHTHVQRWGGALPHYLSDDADHADHADLVEQVRAAVGALPGLAVCGAAYDGVGIAECIASAHRAVEQVVEQVGAG